MLLFVVPVFQDMFANSPGGLPGSTQMVVNISEFIRDPMKGGLLAISLVLAIVMLSFSIKKNYKLRRLWHRIVLKIPLFGGLVNKSSLAKIAMIQGNLRAAGVPEMEALDIAGNSSNNLVIKEAMTDVRRGVFSGEPLSKLFKKTPSIFTPSFVALVSVIAATIATHELVDLSNNPYSKNKNDIVVEDAVVMDEEESKSIEENTEDSDEDGKD